MIVGVKKGITETAAQKALNKALQLKFSKNNAVFLNLIEKSSDGILILNSKEKMIFANHAAIVLLDLDAEHFLDKPLNLNIDFSDNKETQEAFIPKTDGGGTLMEISVLQLDWNDESCYIAIFRSIAEREASKIIPKEQPLRIANGLRKAIREDELFLVYQPIIQLSDLSCCGYEALVRWRHPYLGLLEPDQFIAFAEKKDNIAPIGQWVIKQALEDFTKIKSKSVLFLSLNMSANEFLTADMEENILSSMQMHGISNHQLLIELTETALISQPEITLQKFRRLSEAGIQIAIDDYGIGYSSLSLLKQLPVTIMKIDQSFIANINTNHYDPIIVRSSIQLAHSLGLKVIAEGVETKEQLHFLQKNDCDFIQGFYFSKPLELDALLTYLHKHSLRV